ncbi:MAG: hydrogenase formation protein HypD [Deferribacteraceae bacterium]|jgi:hydrogenase expression/formation protein HypD|nr:hydrogenase formation protein HypD [Deferribacteraceae bacterium]
MTINKLFSGKKLIDSLRDAIFKETLPDKTYRIMEVCGTHTMAAAKYGIPSIIPSNIQLVSGPGCPVCVTSQADIDNCIELAADKRVTVATFGDMMRVVGSGGNSLYQAKAAGADVRTVYSPLDLIKMAREQKSRSFVFIAVGFETTAPMAAGLVKTAHAEGIRNISILSLCKTMPQVFDMLLKDNEIKINGFFCPGNVTVITGLSIYKPLMDAGMAAVVTGFEPADLLSAILEVIRQVNSEKFSVVNNYRRAAHELGNVKANTLTYEVFEPSDARWRGFGLLPSSGLSVREKYEAYDAFKLFGINRFREEKPTPCRCGDILKGRITPKECPMFGKTCTPENAAGPCMVSSEGSCAAYYKYSARGGG